MRGSGRWGGRGVGGRPARRRARSSAEPVRQGRRAAAATAVGAPVSTTHSIVGAVLGAGIAAGGFSAANWPMVSGIVASWVVSPLMGGAIAAGFLFWIKRAITYKTDMVSAAQRTVPILIGIMAFAFCTYLIIKGLSKVISTMQIYKEPAIYFFSKFLVFLNQVDLNK